MKRKMCCISELIYSLYSSLKTQRSRRLRGVNYFSTSIRRQRLFKDIRRKKLNTSRTLLPYKALMDSYPVCVRAPRLWLVRMWVIVCYGYILYFYNKHARNTRESRPKCQNSTTVNINYDFMRSLTKEFKSISTLILCVMLAYIVCIKCDIMTPPPYYIVYYDVSGVYIYCSR